MQGTGYRLKPSPLEKGRKELFVSFSRYAEPATIFALQKVAEPKPLGV